ncbi:hypothetical protein Droror1_Dr00008781 [Drosera rotundifolia]
MSDGGEESKREDECEVRESDRARTDEYRRAVARVAVAQVCEGVGFDCLKESALDALSDMALRFMGDIGESASSYASLVGRAECNVFDVVRALEDIGSTVGFSGAAGSGHCPVGSGVVNEMIGFVETAEEIPFAQPIPQFPVIKNPQGIPSFSQIGEAPGGKHVPVWLPAFPDKHTYVHTTVWNDRKADQHAHKAEQAKQRRKAERSLLNLQQRLLSSSVSGSGNHADVVQEYPVVHADLPKDSVAAESNDSSHAALLPAVENHNPFLAPPLPSGEKDVAAISSPVKVERKEDDQKKHASALEIFAPVIDAMKAGMSESSRSERRVLPQRRSVVHFRLKGGRKMVAEDLDTCIRETTNPRTSSSSFGRGDERDDKKRRAEMILRQSMENTQDIT